MLQISKEEVMKIAALSCIDVQEAHIDALVRQLEDVVRYAARVQELAADSDESADKRINVVRQDSVMRFDSQKILNEAPEREQTYFVVPKILDGAR